MQIHTTIYQDTLFQDKNQYINIYEKNTLAA